MTGLNNPQNLLPLRSQQRVVIVAEDDVTIQNIARIVLERDGFFVLTASDGQEALTISDQFPGRIDALLTDVNMPRLDGLQLTQRILVSRPNIKVLIMSGQIEDPLLSGVSFLRKPFGPPVLRDRVRELFSAPSPAPEPL